ncbi:MAG: metallopeptidase [Nanoarchaeota archaeon]|nr:metallopeptidase [Nanoarchaeota archaeon]
MGKIQYYRDPDFELRTREIAARLRLGHIDFSRVVCVRSMGSKSKRTLARCHTLPRVMQTALAIRPHYIIEIITETFDRLSQEEQIKTIIHELLHIPKTFGGGFRHHEYVNDRTINELYRKYQTLPSVDVLLPEESSDEIE